MLNQVTRDTVKEMSARGISNRQIGKLLQISRMTVRKILRESEPQEPSETDTPIHAAHAELIKEIYAACKGNAVRIMEMLKEQHGIEISYSTLTRWIRRMELRTPVKAKGNFNFLPGEEMQHDTSPFVIPIAGKMVKAQCASLVLWYSRKIFIQFYPCFTRFEARLFLSDAIEFMGGACERCINDNTSVVVVAGTGPNAVIAPEIESLSYLFGTRFEAHVVNHPERKGQVEKQFSYVGNNFLAGRIFTSWEDLNRQAVDWCNNVANAKVKRILGMCPNAAHLLEKPYLKALPAYIPPVYESFFRVVDAQGWVHLASNLYSVPYRFVGRKVEVLKFRAEVRISIDQTEVARHQRVIDQRNQRVLIPGHHDLLPQAHKKKEPLPEEVLLQNDHVLLDRYTMELKKRCRGRGLVQLRRLLVLKRTYPPEAFLYAIERALNYGLYDLNRLENIILTYLRERYFEQ